MKKDFPEFNHLDSYENIYKYSIKNHEDFWATVARNQLLWEKPFTIAADSDFKQGRINWFPDGELNASVNCVDRHAEKNPTRTAFIWEGDDPDQVERISYGELLDLVSKIANVLKHAGVQKGDAVAIYLPSCIQAAAVMMACARLGAPHAVVFAGFSADALADRMNDCGAKVLITMDAAMRAGKTVPLKEISDKAIKNCPDLEQCFVFNRTGSGSDEFLKNKIDVDMDDAIRSSDSTCAPVIVDAEHPLYYLYTSGSTGKPKGLVHTTGGYLTHCALAHKHAYQWQDGDVFGCMADIGWAVGHGISIYGNLVSGGTELLFESLPNFPDPGRYWSMVERHQISQFFSAPTAYRMLMQSGNEWVQKYDRSSLKTIMVAGEMCNDETWWWLNDVVGEGKATVIDCWWQTETGNCMLSPSPGPEGQILAPSKCTRGFYGVEPVLLDEQGQEITCNEQKGDLCIRNPWPGMARTIFNDEKRFFEAYFKRYPGLYETGDAAIRDEEGRLQITGRVDDIINIAGHRISTKEIEEVVLSNKKVSEGEPVIFRLFL